MMVHFILPGDTLQKIAEEIQLENPVYLKEFHNNHCVKEDFITENLVPGKKLLLPNIVEIKAFNAKNDAPFKSPDVNPKIEFNPINFNQNFKVVFTESKNDEGKISENRFSYVANLKWIKNEFNEHLFHFTKDKFSNLHDTKMEFMAIETFKSLLPIEVYVNSKGEILRTALTKQTLNNFNEIKEKLLDLFPDKYAEIYLEEFEYVVLNPEVFDKKMKEDWFLKMYFSSFRNPFKNGKSFFEIYLNQSSVQLQQIVEKSENSDEISLNQFLSDQKEKDFRFNGNLSISKENGMIKKMNAFNSYKEYSVEYSTNLSVSEVL
ncbi:hypothetical protein OF897_18945 [Chryseobacterium formosus]|uniref:LysM domain-containing protein n=1 Tax=Chryseobacterium formosus TaxID=1537363 RepID=A0ABT3XWK5_9FLAO|nr:hypothetical protein [Chryseobacterium formosus]MCX8525996.1 hypothetical protein [Chryseobacterium formosus]